MTEQDYIDATNLARLRTMADILRHCAPMRPEEEELARALRLPLAQWIEYLEQHGAKIRS